MTTECPVAHNKNHGGFTILSSYDDVLRVLRDCETFRSGEGVLIPPAEMPKVPALEYDGAEHAVYRKLMDQPLRLGAVRALQPVIEEVADDLISGFASSGRANLVTEFAEPMPALVIGRMIGLDRERALQMHDVALKLFGALATPDFDEVIADFPIFMRTQLELRRSDPREDYLTQLASGYVDGAEVTEEQAISVLFGFMTGGHHSTTVGICATLRHVLSDPQVRQTFVDDDQAAIAEVIEETLRLDTPLHFFARTLDQDARVRDVDFNAGERVMLNLAAANRDPSVFDDPHEFDAQRAPSRRLAFGNGRHICQGQPLARAEMRTAVAVLLRRLPDVQLSGTIADGPLFGGMLIPVTDIPVAFTPTDSFTSAGTVAEPV